MIDVSNRDSLTNTVTTNEKLSKPAYNSLSHLVWIDLEMSGLNPKTDAILEVAIIVTDSQINIIAESEAWAVSQPSFVLDNMDAWNTRVHNQSGLVERCRKSTNTLKLVEREALSFLKHQKVQKKYSPMCGNSICQDRRFLAEFMPTLEDYFHYRNFDVSSFKIAARLFFPQLAEKISNKKPSEHQALEDIRASIEEMSFYRRHMLIDR